MFQTKRKKNRPFSRPPFPISKRYENSVRRPIARHNRKIVIIRFCFIDRDHYCRFEHPFRIDYTHSSVFSASDIPEFTISIVLPTNSVFPTTRRVTVNAELLSNVPFYTSDPRNYTREVYRIPNPKGRVGSNTNCRVIRTAAFQCLIEKTKNIHNNSVWSASGRQHRVEFRQRVCAITNMTKGRGKTPRRFWRWEDGNYKNELVNG